MPIGITHEAMHDFDTGPGTRCRAYSLQKSICRRTREGRGNMDNESKEGPVDLVHYATAETILSLSCLACGGSLHVQFVPKGPRGKGAGSLYVTCPQCMWRIISEGMPAEPPWVQELGPKVETAKKRKSPQVSR